MEYILARSGKLLSITQQKRIHEPKDGGGSSYRKTTKLNPLLRKYTEKLVRKTGWNGVAMIEFKGSENTDEWNIMEINGRFWGSLPLTISSGLNYPFWLHKLFENNLNEKSINKPIIGTRQRNLKKDIGWIVNKLKENENKIINFCRWLADFRYLFIGRESLDVESFKDPLPGLFEWYYLFHELLFKRLK